MWIFTITRKVEQCRESQDYSDMNNIEITIESIQKWLQMSKLFRHYSECQD
jgi:hypothetical protein